MAEKTKQAEKIIKELCKKNIFVRDLNSKQIQAIKILCKQIRKNNEKT